MTEEEIEEHIDEEEEEEREEVRRVQEDLKFISELDIQRDLVRARQLGDANFSDDQPLFEEIIEYAKRLQGLPWWKLTTAPLSAIGQRTANLVTVLTQVKDFTLQQADPIAARTSLSQQVEANFDALKEATFPSVGYLSWESVNLDEMRREVSSVVDEAKSRSEEAINELKQVRAEAEKALEAIRLAAAEAGVAQHAEVFAAAASRHDTSARWSLAASVVAGIGTLAAAFLLVELWNVKGDISEASVLQLVVAKGAVLAVGFYATVNAVRMFRSQVHLSVVNRHREDALRTFRAFAEGTDDKEVKDKVLLEATHAVFGQAATGLVDGRDSTETIEVLDGVTSMLRRKG